MLLNLEDKEVKEEEVKQKLMFILQSIKMKFWVGWKIYQKSENRRIK